MLDAVCFMRIQQYKFKCRSCKFVYSTRTYYINEPYFILNLAKCYPIPENVFKSDEWRKLCTIVSVSRSWRSSRTRRCRCRTVGTCCGCPRWSPRQPAPSTSPTSRSIPTTVRARYVQVHDMSRIGVAPCTNFSSWRLILLDLPTLCWMFVKT